jgi:hypothetical protein
MGSSAKSRTLRSWRKRITHSLGLVTSPRHYLPAGRSLDSLFAELLEDQIHCTVLRWFDDLPAVAPGEDIDMLVADADLRRLTRRLDPVSGATPFDIYTVSGLLGTSFKHAPYFPSRLAESILANRRLIKGLFPAPSMQDHFDSLAYHAVYHKGLASGLPADGQGRGEPMRADHDYRAVLSRLNDALGLDAEITLQGLDTYLAERGYRPPADVLAKLGKANAWLRARLAEGALG